MISLQGSAYDYSSNQIQTYCTGNPYKQLDSTSFHAPQYDTYSNYCYYGTGAPSCYLYELDVRPFCPCAIRK